MNRVELTACIAEASPLRYTPAGIPALNLVLEHSSEMVEAGTARQVSLIVKAVAFGALAEQSARLQMGKAFRFTGFLANARGNKGVVFHIQAIQLIQVIEPVLEPVPNPI
ncbi:MAG: primosomal replication protein N [Haliea sp.]|nr:MAG: primosomal replication protein N [Haliea sp.]